MTTIQARGTWLQRVGLFLLSSILGVLIFWLLGFILHDITTIPGPQLTDFNNPVTQSLLSQEGKRLDNQIDALQKEMNAVAQQQSYVKNAMAGTQNTINQILDIQRLQAQKGQASTADVNKAFQQNTQVFLVQQNQLQQINNAMTQLNLELLPLQNHKQAITAKLDEAYKQASQRYQNAFEKHQLNLGLLQVSLLILFLLIFSFFILQRDITAYRPIYYAVELAILIKMGFVIHSYLPSRYFKYIITLVLIFVVFSLLKSLLKRRAFPAKDYLIKQYKDAYAHFFCPVCEYPIRRGPLRYAFWTRSSIARIYFLDKGKQEEVPYHCPQCGTSLYENCQQCQQTRHSLLPYCEHCGSEQAI